MLMMYILTLAGLGPWEKSSTVFVGDSLEECLKYIENHPITDCYDGDDEIGYLYQIEGWESGAKYPFFAENRDLYGKLIIYPDPGAGKWYFEGNKAYTGEQIFLNTEQRREKYDRANIT